MPDHKPLTGEEIESYASLEGYGTLGQLARQLLATMEECERLQSTLDKKCVEAFEANGRAQQAEAALADLDRKYKQVLLTQQELVRVNPATTTTGALLESQQERLRLLTEIRDLKSALAAERERPTHPPTGAIDYPAMVSSLQAQRDTAERKLERVREVSHDKRIDDALGGCSGCEYDEAEGAILNHCDDCCRAATTEMWLLVSSLRAALADDGEGRCVRCSWLGNRLYAPCDACNAKYLDRRREEERDG